MPAETNIKNFVGFASYVVIGAAIILGIVGGIFPGVTRAIGTPFGIVCVIFAIFVLPFGIYYGTRDIRSLQKRQKTCAHEWKTTWVGSQPEEWIHRCSKCLLIEKSAALQERERREEAWARIRDSQERRF